MKKFRLLLSSLAVLTATSVAAQAHTGVGATSGLAHGFAHPFGGLDHLLAMIAVGLWATQLAQSRKSALWIVPLAFIAAMTLGGVLGASGIAVPFAETGILLSVLVLGVLVAAAVKLPLAASVAVVGLFALFHGHAHGMEMPETASGFLYGAGFVTATASLHAIGLTLGVLSQQKATPQNRRFDWTRAAGTAIALGSIVIFLQK